MKLVIVLMLSALPLYCYAGSGCLLPEIVVNKTIDPNESKAEFMKDFEEFIRSDFTKQALKNLKQCFLDQDKETLSNIRVMMDAVVNSKQCASY